MKLTTKAVHEIMRDCLFREEEYNPTNDEPPADAIIVEGIRMKWAYHPGRTATHTDEIGALLAELPNEFQRTGGGGWSFLNACMDREGTQWGEHPDMEALFCLGIACGKARWLMGRDMWNVFPGGMPYVQVN